MKYRGWVTDQVKEVPELVPGSHIVALCDPTEIDAFGLTLRQSDVEIRDCLFIPVSTNQQHFALLGRYTLEADTIASNVSRYSTGMIDIDACRITSTGDHKRPYQPTNNDRDVYGEQAGFEPTNSDGRFPSNCVWFHRPECECVGTKRVQGAGWRDSDSSGAGMGYHGAQGNGGLHYVDENGEETVTDWQCTPGCPVMALDAQSGVLVSKWGKQKQAHADKTNDIWGSYGENDFERSNDFVGDVGGASRYFRQVLAKDELTDLLIRLVHPDVNSVLVNLEHFELE